MSKQFVFALCALTASGMGWAADTPLEIPLGGDTSITAVTKNAGSYKIVLKNAIPLKEYRLRISTQPGMVSVPEPLSHENKFTGNWGDVFNAVQFRKILGDVGNVSDSCNKAIDAKIKEISAAADEKAVVTRLVMARSAIKAESSCSIEAKADGLNRVDAIVVREVPGSIDIEPSDVTTVEVLRVKEDGSETVSVGKVILTGKGEAQGRWLVLYGFNFIEDDDRKYFTKEQRNNEGTVSDYVITAERGNGGSVLAPSVYFMYVPPGNKSGLRSPIAWGNGNLFGGFAAGLGFDKSSPNVFLGYGVGWGSNVMVTGGLVYRQVQRLSGRYNENDVVHSVLTEDLVEKTYEPAAYVGLAFRFGSNPFNAAPPAPVEKEPE